MEKVNIIEAQSAIEATDVLLEREAAVGIKKLLTEDEENYRELIAYTRDVVTGFFGEVVTSLQGVLDGSDDYYSKESFDSWKYMRQCAQSNLTRGVIFLLSRLKFKNSLSALRAACLLLDAFEDDPDLYTYPEIKVVKTMVNRFAQDLISAPMRRMSNNTLALPTLPDDKKNQIWTLTQMTHDAEKIEIFVSPLIFQYQRDVFMPFWLQHISKKSGRFYNDLIDGYWQGNNYHGCWVVYDRAYASYLPPTKAACEKYLESALRRAEEEASVIM